MGGALAVILLLRTLIAVPIVQMVLITLVVKHVFAATVTGFLGRDGRAGVALAGDLLALSIECFKGRNWLKAPTEAITAELALSDSPFSDAFGGALTVFRNKERFVFDGALLFPRESLCNPARLVQQFEALPRLRCHGCTAAVAQ
jgi:hypothetical protein